MKQIKNYLVIMFIMLATFILQSCQDSNNCQHEWKDLTVLVSETCTTTGLKEQKCNICHETKTVEVEALGHDLETVAAQSATCTEEGYEAHENCLRCDYDTKGSQIPALNHQFSQQLTQDILTHYYKCERDGCNEKKDEAEHIDEDNDHICDDCQKSLHTFKTDSWAYDSTGHYHACSKDNCPEKVDFSAHEYENGVCKTCKVKNTFTTEGLTFEYNSETKTYSVKAYTGTILDVTIPYFYDDGTNGEHKVTEIGKYAFANGKWDSIEYSNNNAITSIIIPDSIETIGKYAFVKCEEITNVVIPNSVTRIEAAAFSTCTKLMEFTFSNNITYAGGSIFYNSGWYNNQPDGLIYIDNYVYGYKGYPKEEVQVVVKDGITGIFSLAFYSRNITSVTLPDSIVWIGSNAFSSSKIKSISLGTKLEIIQENAFYDCINLTSIDIPYNVKKIERSAFGNCLNMKEITVNNPNTDFGTYIFASAGTRNPTTTILKINLPEGMTKITNGMFSGAAITTIKIPSTVTEIGDSAFRQCYRLTSFEIGENINSIGYCAFGNCTALTSITIHENVQVISDEAFFRCLELKSIELPWTLEEIKTKSSDINSDHWFTSMDNDFIIYYKGGSFKPYHSKIEEKCSTDGVVEYWQEILTNKTFNSNGYYNYTEITDLVIPAGCKGGTATCLEKAICINCNQEYGEPLGHSPTTWKYDKDNHWKECSRSDCTSKLNEGSHEFEDGICTVCKTKNIYGTEGLEYEYYLGNQSCSLKSYSGTDKNVIIPEYYKADNGWYYKITSIDSYAFKNNTTIESIIIPNTITTIRYHVFDGCSNLKEITFSSSSLEINSWCFEGCTSLSKVNIDSLDKWLNYSFSSNTANPLYYAKNLYINGELLTDLIIPEGITVLKECVFINTTSLKSVTLPSTLKNMESNVFYGCTSLNRVNIPSLENWLNLKYSDSNSVIYSNPLYYAKHLYINGKLLTDLVIPEGIIGLNSYAFANCVDLKSVVLPSTLTGNTSYAFTGCYSLETFTYGADLTKSFGSLFGTTQYENSAPTLHNNKLTYYIPLKLKTVNILGKTICEYAFMNCNTITNITFDNVTTIGAYAFKNCRNLYSISLPSTLTSIGEYAFEFCHGLVEIYNYSSFNLTAGSQNDGAVALKALRIVSDDSASKVSIDNDGFAFYTDGSEVSLIGYVGNQLHLNLPEGITRINKYALYEHKMTTVTVPEGVKSIGNDAFGYCPHLAQIYLPDSLEIIENSVFYGTASLTSITLPKNLKTIEWGAFYSAVKLVEIVNLSSLELEIASDAHGGVARNAKSIVTSISDSKISIDNDGYVLYTTEEDVSVVGYIGSNTNINIPTNVTSIYDYAFYKNMYITSVNIPGNVKTIGSDAFYGCTNLQELVINEGVENILSYAFSSIESLKAKIIIPGSVKTIGRTAFGYSGITEVVISSGVETIESQAFIFCSSLKTIYIPKTVTTLNEGCFSALNYLKEINYEGTVEEWNKITKSETGTGIYKEVVIKCADNAIDRDGNIITTTDN